jgi:hypothetical protein
MIGTQAKAGNVGRLNIPNAQVRPINDEVNNK